MRRLRGELVHWNDARGFGFIAGEDGQRYFVHISAIARIATRPRQGDTMSFVGALGRKQQLEARSVVIAGANPVAMPARQERSARELDWQVVLAFTLLGLLGYLVWRDPSAAWLLAPYGVGGAVTAYLYFADKRAAEAGQWRVSEAALHGFDLAFGIIGGLLAQAVLCHKTRKTSFVLVTLAIGFLHLALLAGVAIGEIGIQALLSEVLELLRAQ